MKTLLFFAAFSISSLISFSAITTITNSGFTFSPAVATIHVGDTVVFSLGESHNAIEVSELTWNNNGSTPLPGFSVPFGGGIVTGLAAGEHFYVCAPHASGGMKGKIVVQAPSGLQEEDAFEQYFALFPNPSSGHVTVNMKDRSDLNSLAGSQWEVEILAMNGQIVHTSRGIDLNSRKDIDISSFPAGQYILAIRNEKRLYTVKLTKY